VPGLTHVVCLDRRIGDDPSLDEFASGAPATPLPDFSDPFGAPDDVVGLFPTGGTTGPSKGVVVTNLGWGTMLETLGAAIGGDADNPVSLVVAPVTHAAGPVALGTLALGATQVILPGFDADTVLRTIPEYHVTHMYLPPTALYGLLGSPELGRQDTSSLRFFILVGSPVSPEKLRQAVEAFGSASAGGAAAGGGAVLREVEIERLVRLGLEPDHEAAGVHAADEQKVVLPRTAWDVVEPRLAFGDPALQPEAGEVLAQLEHGGQALGAIALGPRVGEFVRASVFAPVAR